MGKNKLEKFADMASYPHVFEYPYSAVDNVPFGMKGKWHKEFFKNDHPIVLELGCGRGEYTVGLGKELYSSGYKRRPYVDGSNGVITGRNEECRFPAYQY